MSVTADHARRCSARSLTFAVPFNRVGGSHECHCRPGAALFGPLINIRGSLHRAAEAMRVTADQARRCSARSLTRQFPSIASAESHAFTTGQARRCSARSLTFAVPFNRVGGSHACHYRPGTALFGPLVDIRGSLQSRRRKP